MIDDPFDPDGCIESSERIRGYFLNRLPFYAVFGVLLAVMVLIGFSNLAPSRMNGCGGSPVGDVRTVHAAEEAYRRAGLRTVDGVGQYGTLAELAVPIPPFIDSALASGNKYGYEFVLVVYDGDPPGFECFAIPRPGYESVRSFYTNESGVVRFTADGTTPGPDSPEL